MDISLYPWIYPLLFQWGRLVTITLTVNQNKSMCKPSGKFVTILLCFTNSYTSFMDAQKQTSRNI